MKTIYILFLTAAIACMYSCSSDRIEVNSGDKTPPGKPVFRSVKPLYGGARIFYDIPSDKDLLSINAEFIAANGKTFSYSASYFVDSLDVYGLGDTKEYLLKLYALDRAGNRSEYVDVKVTPLEAVISRVAQTLEVKSGFSSFYVDWQNELMQTVNIYIDFDFVQNGVKRDMITVFSSNLIAERRFVNDLTLGPDEPINIRIRVEDIYGNITEPINFGQFRLLQDNQIPKAEWVLPRTGDSIAGIPMCYGNGFDGRLYRVIDGEIDKGESSNYMHSGGIGRTGSSANGNVPWNLIIDLGDYYELSRIVTHQRHSGGANSLAKGQYYQAENVGLYSMYVLNEELNQWDSLTTIAIPIPVGLNEIEIVRLGDAGDMAYMYPDSPKFTRPARWFRYEALRCFNSNYTSTEANCLSEVTLYGRKASR